MLPVEATREFAKLHLSSPVVPCLVNRPERRPSVGSAMAAEMRNVAEAVDGVPCVEDLFATVSTVLLLIPRGHLHCAALTSGFVASGSLATQRQAPDLRKRTTGWCTLRGPFRTHRRRSGGCWRWRLSPPAKGLHSDGAAEQHPDGSHKSGLVDLLQALANPCWEARRLLAMADEWRLQHDDRTHDREPTTSR